MTEQRAIHASLNQEQVNHIIRIVARASGMTFVATRDMLAMRWAQMARERIRENSMSYAMWEEMVEMARRSVP